MFSVNEETTSFSRISDAQLRLKTILLDPLVFSMKINMGKKDLEVRLIEEIGHGQFIRWEIGHLIVPF